MIAPQLGPVADLGGNLIKSGQQSVKPAQEPGWFASMLKSISDSHKVVKEDEISTSLQNVNIGDGDASSNATLQTSEEGEQHISLQNGAHAAGTVEVRREAIFLNDASVKEYVGSNKHIESLHSTPDSLSSQTESAETDSSAGYRTVSESSLNQNSAATSVIVTESGVQVNSADATASQSAGVNSAADGFRLSGQQLSNEGVNADGKPSADGNAKASTAAGNERVQPAMDSPALAVDANNGATQTGDPNANTPFGSVNAGALSEASGNNTAASPFATSDGNILTSVNVDSAIPPALDSNTLTEANTEGLKSTANDSAAPLQAVDARLTGAMAASGRSPVAVGQSAIPIQPGVTAQSPIAPSSISAEISLSADDITITEDGEIQAAPVATMQRTERHVAPGSDRNATEFSSRLESAINSSGAGSSSGQGNQSDGRPFQGAAVPNSVLTENIPGKAEIDSFKEALANSGLEMLRAVDNPADGFSRLAQVAVPHIGLRREVLPALQQMVKDVSESARTAPETWQKHNFVMDDGHRVDVMVRQVEGVMHLKLSASNPELSRLLEEYALEIEEHLKETLAVAVDLQFGQGAADGQAMGTGFGDFRPKSPYANGLSDLRRAKDAAELTKNAQNVRYFGYNSTEWTA